MGERSLYFRRERRVLLNGYGPSLRVWPSGSEHDEEERSRRELHVRLRDVLCLAALRGLNPWKVGECGGGVLGLRERALRRLLSLSFAAVCVLGFCVASFSLSVSFSSSSCRLLRVLGGSGGCARAASTKVS